ncbi:SDR family oxidoreductase [Chitinophaga sp. GCM10012297]|uniref:SDR family oxidoreductase n=1 Tax=Chitinophaga chungangae TaxID=2821488 RepID=A0ABS3YH14_9BACT|nr:SDR family oxidoreductase [Chitinophaga chungangae]MBO9153934.1 SDR family oxidoreductase [Chitinophaga chungangae]
MENAPDIHGKILKDISVLVTGGTTGIGRATALLLAQHGAKVLIFGRHEKELNEVLEEFNVNALEENVMGIIADVSKKEDIEFIFQQGDGFLGQLHVLVNNAALGYQSIMDGKYEDWQYILQVNMLGYMACVHEAVKRMKDKGGGHIVNIGSMSADKREKGSSVYVATKAGIQGFSETLRKEVNELGIKVTLIEPGAVDTDMQPGGENEKREKIKNMEMLKSEDIAQCVLYVLTQPKRCDVVEVKIRPHLQLI